MRQTEVMTQAANSGDGRVKIIGGLIVGLIVVGIIGSAVLARRDRGSIDGAATLPVTVRSDFGVPYPGTANAGAPVVSLYEDFQCPACGDFEAAAGEHIGRLAREGKISLIWYPVAFLDDNPAVRQANRDNDNPDSSKRAMAAFGCAIDHGKAPQFHDAVFAAQPEEGRGYSTDTLKGLASALGLNAEQSATYVKCIEDEKYLPWAKNATLAFRDSGIGGTPTVLVNGEQVDIRIAADAAQFEQLIAGATK